MTNEETRREKTEEIDREARKKEGLEIQEVLIFTTCPICGHRYIASDGYCPKCGAKEK